MGIWTLEKYSYAGHEITIKYKTYNRTLYAYIKGPRASSVKRDRYANTVKKKVSTRLPFTTPSPKRIDEEAHNLYRNAKKEIDTAMIAHAKKHREEYQ